MFIDTHTHLFYKEILSQIDDVIDRAKTAKISNIICVSTNLENAKKCIKLAIKYDFIYTSVGIHPQDCKNINKNFLDEIEKLSLNKKNVAIGEIGLDYYRDYTPKKIQKDVFSKQLELAKKINLPSIIHCRNAENDILDIIDYVQNYNVVFHCFSSDLNFAKKLISKGCLISFTGNITFGNNHIESIIKEIKLDKIMLETDCPFLTPIPNRGKLNEPSNITFIAKKISEIKNISLDKVSKITTNNAKTFFKI